MSYSYDIAPRKPSISTGNALNRPRTYCDLLVALQLVGKLCMPAPLVRALIASSRLHWKLTMCTESNTKSHTSLSTCQFGGVREAQSRGNCGCKSNVKKLVPQWMTRQRLAGVSVAYLAAFKSRILSTLSDWFIVYFRVVFSNAIHKSCRHMKSGHKQSFH